MWWNLLDAQNRVQANGRTRMLTMLVPDKSSAYARYLDAPFFRRIGKLAPLLDGAGLNVVDVVPALKRAIDAGVDDVYMPNDTHWSSIGHDIAVREIVRRMNRETIAAD